MINILTIDLEDYYQVSAFDSVVKREDWDKYESRIERNTYRLLKMLHECKSNVSANASNVSPQTSNLSPYASCLTTNECVKATFFCLGWIAERYPDLIREIHRQGHEIACHSYDHRLVYHMTPNEFREDIRKSRQILEDTVSDDVVGYRAPSYSITIKSQWAFEVLMEEGFRYDSSIFPIHHDVYGFPTAPRFPFLISMNGNNAFEFQMLNSDFGETQLTQVFPINSTNPSNPSNPSTPRNSGAAPEHSVTPNSELPTPNCLLEFPISTLRICGQNVPISGGGYFRLFHYSLIKKGLKRINEGEGKPFIFYLHPWELDQDQPKVNSASFKSRFRHYINLDKTEPKFRRLLTDFRFSSISNVLNSNTATPQPICSLSGL